MANCGKIVINILALVLGIGSLVGFVGAIVVIGMWWGNIRYDYPYPGNEGETPFNLYVVVLSSWVMPIICFCTASLARVPQCCGLKMISNLLITASIWSGIAEVCCLSFTLYYSTQKFCVNIENESYNGKTNNTGYDEWLNKQTKNMNETQRQNFIDNLSFMRCTHPHDLLVIYLSLFIGTIVTSFIFVIISRWCSSEKHPELEALTDETRRTFNLIN